GRVARATPLPRLADGRWRRGWAYHSVDRLCHAEAAPILKHDERGYWVWDLAYYPDGRLLAGSSAWDPAKERAEGVLKLWDAPAGRCLVARRDHRGGIWAVAVSPDGRRVATGSSAGGGGLRDPGPPGGRARPPARRQHPPPA